MTIITNTISLLLEIKRTLDIGKNIRCLWSNVSYNPNIASVTYYDDDKNYIRGKIFDFNPPGLPTISRDDITELEVYVKTNSQILSKIEKLYAFI